MEQNARLALIREHLQAVLAIRDPTAVSDWQPSDALHEVYVGHVQNLLSHVSAFVDSQRKKLLDGGTPISEVPEEQLRHFRGEVEPRLPSLRAAFRSLEPEIAELIDAIDARPSSGHAALVRWTFETGLNQAADLVDRNPDMEFNLRLERSWEVMDSALIDFSPDAWLDRADQLPTLRTHRRAAVPSHVSQRLADLYRSYVFGCWLSVVSMARAILEYALLDNLHKFGINSEWPQSAVQRQCRDKSLKELIEEVGRFLPDVEGDMHFLRETGNDYLHPRKKKTQPLFHQEATAGQVVARLVPALERLYLAPSKT
jgi:hypothetical protein